MRAVLKEIHDQVESIVETEGEEAKKDECVGTSDYENATEAQY
jgi:hypothetical protein